MSSKKIFDVAISFRWKPDNRHALAVYEKLAALGLEVFYSERRPEEFVGTDGEQSFGEVFRDRARFVVVLVRNDWGETKFTRAENNALRQRADAEGWSFSLFVQMAKNVSMPTYLPPERIWGKWSDLGVDGLVATVVERLQDIGRSPRPVTALDTIKELMTMADLNVRRKQFISSEEGAGYFKSQVKEMSDMIEISIGEVSELAPDVISYNEAFEGIKEGWQRQAAHGLAGSLMVRCSQNYHNNANGAFVEFYIKGRSGHGRQYRETEHTLSKWSVTLNSVGQPSLAGIDGAIASAGRIVRDSVQAFAIKCAEMAEAQSRR